MQMYYINRTFYKLSVIGGVEGECRGRQGETMTNEQFDSCLALMKSMNDDQSVYESFRAAMQKGGNDFASWMSSNGVPEDLAKALANASSEGLATLIGDQITEKFW